MMNQACFSLVCLSALLAAPLVIAQPADSQIAVEVAVKRLAAVIDARTRLGEARLAEARKEILAASQQHNKALELVQGIGPMAEPERLEGVAGLSRTTLVLAERAMDREDFVEARLHIDRVLKVDPRNKDALALREKNERLMAENVGLTPHEYARDTLRITETRSEEHTSELQSRFGISYAV